MPHNLGVAFSKGNKFWKAVLEEMKGQPRDLRDWFGDQIAVGKIVKSNRFNVHVLDHSFYNYTPKSKNEDVSKRYIVHYKGKRKAWMPESPSL